MPRNPVTRATGWAGLVLTALLVLASCGDDSGSIPANPTDEEPDAAPLDTASPGTTPVSAEDTVPAGGEDRSAELIGSWEIVNYTLSAGGGLTNIVGEVTPFIEFRADGTLTFQTGCNGGDASWEASGSYAETTPLDDEPAGQPILITAVSKEQVACEGFLGEQDLDISTNLADAERFRLADDGGMSLLDEFVLIIAEPA